ncbi:MAG: hypothetical protein ACI9MB_005132, partial [Verrucomicrobiales bacterium]
SSSRPSRRRLRTFIAMSTYVEHYPCERKH